MRPSDAMHAIHRWCRAHHDLVAIGALIMLAFAFLSPALKDGFALGNYDVDLSLTSLTHGAYLTVHNPFNGDAVSQMIAWNTLDWQTVHHLHFPLWNSYSALGMPQFLNFESSVLSLPDLVSYLVPLKFAFLVVVFVKLILAGTGTYAFARALGLRVVSAFFGGATFMLSGAFTSWLTWPLSDVAAWSGWIAAFAVLAYRDRWRAWSIVGLAVAVAFSVYGGFPEANVMYAVIAIAFVVIAAVVAAIVRQRIDWRGCARVVVGGVFGVALSAPLWLPGLQVISASHRTQEGHYVGLPVRSLPTLFSQGYFGMPVGSPRSPFQLSRWNYYETVSYVGILALVFVVVALVKRWDRPVVVGLFAALLVSLALTYEPVAYHPLQSLSYHLRTISSIRFERMRVFTGFLVAVLAAFGIDDTVGSWSDRATRRTVFGASVLGVVVVGWSVIVSHLDHLVGIIHAVRVSALRWPVILAVGMVIVGATGLRRGGTSFIRWAVIGVTSAQVAFLFFAGASIPTYSPSVYPVTPAVAQLQAIVGTSLVGLDGGNSSNVRLFTHIGFYPNVNIGYHIEQFGIHDPLIPKAYFASWPDQAAAPENFGVGLFTPNISTASLARRYGISYVLAPPGTVAPSGMTFVTAIAGEPLFRVAGAARYAVVAAGGKKASGTVGPVTGFASGHESLTVNVAQREVHDRLVVRVTDTPGWHATVDGHAVAIHPYDAVMMSIAVPPGQHHVVIWYWPKRLSEGILLAVLSAVAFGISLIAITRRARRQRAHELREESEDLELARV